MSDKTPAQLLREGANVLADRGWAQGKFQLTTGECCLEGAVRIAAYGDAYAATRTSGLRALRAVSRSVGRWPSGWNDASERTAAEVIAKLREVADQIDASAVSA